jgi:hypothetical protein
VADRVVDARVALHRLDGPGPLQRGGDAEDSGAGAEVEDASLGARIARRSPGQRCQAQPGGRMEPRSEAGAGIDDERRSAMRSRIVGLGLPGGDDAAEAGDVDRAVAGAELGLPVVGLLAADGADLAAVERREDRGGRAGARFVAEPKSGGDRVARRHPVTVGVACCGVEHHRTRGEAGGKRLLNIERALVDAAQARSVEQFPDEEEKIVAREPLSREECHLAGDRDIDDPAGVGGRFHRGFQRWEGRDAPCRGA